MESQPGHGATFSVYFPATSATPPEPVATPQLSDLGGQRLILVVDDDEVVRQVATSTHQRCGYEVALAANGLGALRVLRDAARRVRAVVLDLTMPVMDGETALARAASGAG